MSLNSRRFLSGIAVVLLLSASVNAQSVESPDDLLQLERERYDAMVEVDTERLLPMLDDELIFTHASGKVDSKTTFMESLLSGNLDYRSIELADQRARRYDSVGIVTGRSILDINVSAEDRLLELRFTSVWVRVAGGWKIVAYQSTRAR